MEKTHPIVLIECMRKMFVKIVNNRLSDTLSKHQVLKGLNYAGLKNEDVRNPISTLMNVIEDTRDNKKELWITFQDMAKAYDSVGMVPLRKALKRIKLPENIISFIIFLFNNRSIRVITYYGLSNAMMELIRVRLYLLYYGDTLEIT